MSNGRCLRVKAGDNFFSAGTRGQMTAWWAAGTVASDFYFKNSEIPNHVVVAESKFEADGGRRAELRYTRRVCCQRISVRHQRYSTRLSHEIRFQCTLDFLKLLSSLTKKSL